MMIIQHPNFLGLLHILKHYNFKSEFCTVVRCLVFAVLSQNQCHNLVSYFGLKMVPVSKMKNMRYAVVQRPRLCLFLRIFPGGKESNFARLTEPVKRAKLEIDKVENHLQKEYITYIYIT